MMRFLPTFLRKALGAPAPVAAALRVAKKYPLEKPVLLTNTDGHTHLIDLADGPGGETTYGVDSEGRGHSHPWVQDAGVVTIGASDGHTHAVRDPKTYDEAAKSMIAKALDPNAEVRNRGMVVFPADSSDVTDHQDHFPINSEAQARNALARAAQFDAAPSWFKGTLEEL
jgi:hypothetical protein